MAWGRLTRRMDKVPIAGVCFQHCWPHQPLIAQAHAADRVLRLRRVRLLVVRHRWSPPEPQLLQRSGQWHLSWRPMLQDEHCSVAQRHAYARRQHRRPAPCSQGRRVQALAFAHRHDTPQPHNARLQ
eukprot:5537682-Pleurochrysis_carterae.AAC.2